MIEWKDLTERKQEQEVRAIAGKIVKQYNKLERRWGCYLAMAILMKALSEIFEKEAKKQAGEKK